MDLKEELRLWLRAKIKERGYGAGVRLAKYLELKPMQVSNMLNAAPGRKDRNIKAEELLKIMRFLEIKVDDPFLSLTHDLSAALPAQDNSDKAVILRIYNNAKPEQKKLILNLLRSLARDSNIPH